MSEHILVAGATGYVGRRLVPELIHEGYRVRCLVRDQERFRSLFPESNVNHAVGDPLRADTLETALEGIDTAYYLLHSLRSGRSKFEELDYQAAKQFGRAAHSAGVQRMIYLGSLTPRKGPPSPHIRSRIATGQALRESGIPVTEFRAGAIIGQGSLSFEMIRFFVERFHLILLPAWSFMQSQPIGISDVLRYLVESLKQPRSSGEIIEIGGDGIVTYAQLFKTYARLRGLRRLVVGVKRLSNRYAFYSVSTAAPWPSDMVRALIEGLATEVVVQDPKVASLFSFSPVSWEKAMHLALIRFQRGSVEELQSRLVLSAKSHGELTHQLRREGIGTIVKMVAVPSSAEDIFESIEQFMSHTRVSLFLGPVLNASQDERNNETKNWTMCDKTTAMVRYQSRTYGHVQFWLEYSVTRSEGQSFLTQLVYIAPRGKFGYLMWRIMHPIRSIYLQRFLDRLVARWY